MIRILLADDHLLFRSMLEEMLRRDGGIEIVASCGDGNMVLEACRKTNPDIALLDIGMPGMGGIEALRELKEACPKTKAVMLTTFEDQDNMRSAICYGADGYLIKDMEPETLIMSLKCIHRNMVLFHNSIYGLIQSALLESHEDRDAKVQIDHMVFDRVDLKIMALIVKGNSNKDIGTILNYSEGTIKNKVSKLLALTGLSDRTELSVFAVTHGLI